MGWVKFNPAQFAETNVVTWIKKDGSDVTAQYPAGFSNSLQVAGSLYLDLGVGVLPIPVNIGDKVIVSEGNLAAPVTNLVTAVVGSKVTLTATNTLGVVNKATIGFKGKDGTFSGGWLNPSVKTKTLGVVLQNTNKAAGFFIGTTQSGSVRIEPVVP
jgi:hypothetical protein